VAFVIYRKGEKEIQKIVVGSVFFLAFVFANTKDKDLFFDLNKV
jgi:hypothetical protein